MLTDFSKIAAASEEADFPGMDSPYVQQLMELFPDQEGLVAEIQGLRKENGITDMKRGELYPEVIAISTALRRLIALTYGLEFSQAQPNFGCNGCIDSFFQFVLHTHRSLESSPAFAVALPTYFRYQDKARNLGFEIVGVPFGKDGSCPVEQILRSVRQPEVRFLLLVTPNNPTGVPILDHELFEIIERVPEDLIVVVDRTCVNTRQEISSRKLLEKFAGRKLVIFHSFSKYHGLSHQRIGFSLVGNVELSLEMQRYLPFGLGLHASLLAARILAKGKELKPSARILQNIGDNKAAMMNFLKKNSEFTCSDFRSNYAVVGLPSHITGSQMHKALWNRRISVMPGEQIHGEGRGTIRIHCGGPPTDFQKMLDTMGEFVQQ